MSHAATRTGRAAPAGLVLLAAGALAASAQDLLPPIDRPPHAGAVRQLRMPPPVLEPSLESRVRASGREPAARTGTPSQAFRAELRDEAIEYRFTNRWAYADEELAGDRPVRRGRARAAEGMLADATGAWLEALLHRRVEVPPRAAKAARVAGGEDRAMRQRLRVDSSPSWRIEGEAGRTRLRLDVPLSAHEDLALRCTRRLDSRRHPRELGASLRVNPWDASLRFGFELEF